TPGEVFLHAGVGGKAEGLGQALGKPDAAGVLPAAAAVLVESGDGERGIDFEDRGKRAQPEFAMQPQRARAGGMVQRVEGGDMLNLQFAGAEQQPVSRELPSVIRRKA